MYYRDLETAKKRGLIPYFDFKNQFTKPQHKSSVKTTPPSTNSESSNTTSLTIKNSKTAKKTTTPAKKESASSSGSAMEDKGRWLTRAGQRVFLYKGKSYQGRFAATMAKSVSSTTPTKRKAESISTTESTKVRKSKQIVIESDDDEN